MDRRDDTVLAGKLLTPCFAPAWRGPDPTSVQKCLETGETTKLFEYVTCLETAKTSKSLEYGRCLETGNTTKSLGQFLFNGFCCFSCFWTLSVFKGFVVVSRHFPYSKDFVVSLFPNTINLQKCLETGKTTKSFEKIIIVKGFCHFSCL